LTVLHRLQRLKSSGDPQSLQNFAPAGLMWSQKRHWPESIEKARQQKMRDPGSRASGGLLDPEASP